MRPKSHAELAREGDLEALAALADLDPAGRNDRLAYKWLCAAGDFGHAEAGERASDLLECSSLRYDDSGCEVAAAHWELAAAYLAGDDGLARDLALANAHLELAFESHDLAAIAAGTNEPYSADAAIGRLDAEARRLLEFHLGGGDRYRRVRQRVERLGVLRACGAPDVIVEHEKALLREAADELFAAGPAALAAAPGLVAEGGERSLDALRDEVEGALAR